MSQKKNAIKTPVTTSLQEYIDEYVGALTSAITDGFNDQESLIGPEHVRLLAMTTVTAIVAAIMYKELRTKVEGPTTKAKEEALIARINESKGLMQDSVAAGFALAMSKFSGKQIDYYCQVRPVPEPKSKALN